MDRAHTRSRIQALTLHQVHHLVSFLSSLAARGHAKAIQMSRINRKVLMHQHVPSSHSLQKFSLLLRLCLLPLLRMVPANLLKLLLGQLLPLLAYLIGQPTSTRLGIPSKPMRSQMVFLLVL